MQIFNFTLHIVKYIRFSAKKKAVLENGYQTWGGGIRNEIVSYIKYYGSFTKNFKKRFKISYKRFTFNIRGDKIKRMKKQVIPVTAPLRGQIEIPSDKSISHRAVMFSSLAKGRSVIRNFSKGADCVSSLNVCRGLGASINYLDDKTIEVISDGVLKAPAAPLDCGNSGTTMRLMSGILAGQNFNSVLTGDESLSKRPMKRVIEPLSLMGADIASNDNKAPLTINGKKLHAIDYISKLASAQVKSCILLAGLFADGVTSFTEPVRSRDHTERMLKSMGADIKIDGNRVSVLKSELKPLDITVPGDISSAAFFIVAGLVVPESEILLKNIGVNPARTGIIDVVKRMGGAIELLNERDEQGEPVADIRVKYSKLKGCEISGADIPRLIDELPVIAVLATQAEGMTVVKDAGDLRNKEADRITTVVNALKLIGADIEENPDGFVINGKTELRGGCELETFHDHRLVMSYYVAGLICKEPVVIDGFEWSKISFPEFETLMENLKGG